MTSSYHNEARVSSPLMRSSFADNDSMSDWPSRHPGIFFHQEKFLLPCRAEQSDNSYTFAVVYGLLSSFSTDYDGSSVRPFRAPEELDEVVKVLSPSVVAPVTKVCYRKARGDSFWHFCRNCKSWPSASYDERDLEHPPMGGFCRDCIQKHREGKCQGFSVSHSE